MSKSPFMRPTRSKGKKYTSGAMFRVMQDDLSPRSMAIAPNMAP